MSMRQHFRDIFTRHVRKSHIAIIGGAVYPTSEDWRLIYPSAHSYDTAAADGVTHYVDLELPWPQDSMGVEKHERYDYIECCSVLEHAQRPWAMAANIQKMLEPRGCLFVSVPWIWRTHGYPMDYWRLNHETLKILFPGIIWERHAYASDTTVFPSSRTPKVPKGDHTLYPKTECFAVGYR